MADCRKRIAEVEAEKATELLRKETAAEAEKREFLERLSNPSGVSDEEQMRRDALILKRAVDNGLIEVRGPNQKLKCKIVDFPGAMPGDLGITWSWS